jgi:hypothetical protein
MNRSIALSATALVLLAACGGKPPAATAPAAPEAPPAAPAAAAAPEPVTVEEVVERTALVEAIDLENRLVTLKSDDGEVATIQVGEEVRNLPQLKVGDRVVARYYQAIGAQVKAPGTPDAPAIDLAAERAPEGATPAGAVGRKLTVPVTIAAVKNDGKVVSFYGEDGLMRVIEVQRPEGQAFAQGLKEGDKVELTFTEALAISVEPVPAAETAPAPAP